MTIEEALKIVGKNKTKTEIKSMALALSLCPWLNNEDDARRLQASKIILNKKEKDNEI